MSALTKEQASIERIIPEIRANHRECIATGKSAVNHAIEAGKLLWKLKESCKHGEWENAVERCEFSLSTAKAYMTLAQKLPAIMQKAGKEASSEITIRGAQKLISQIGSAQAISPNTGGKSGGTSKTDDAKPGGKPLSQSDAPPAEPAATEDDGEDWLNDHVREEPAKPEGWKPPEGVKQFADSFEVDTPESKDAFGSEVCEELAPAFGLCEEFDAQRAKLTGIKSWLTQRIEHPGAVVLKTAAQRLRTAIDEADGELRFSKPHCECVYCHNKPPKVHNCTACKGLGWMTKPLYDAAPKEMKRAKAQG